MIDQDATETQAARPRAFRLGALAGLIGIGCCVYPVAFVMFTGAAAVEAVALGNRLYGEWGWAFRIAGAMVGLGGVIVQLRRRHACSLRGVRTYRRYLVAVVGIAVAVYWILYGITTWLGSLAT